MPSAESEPPASKAPRKPRSKRKATAEGQDTTPLPFAPDSAIQALSAAGRFVASRLAAHHAIRVTALIRGFPELGTWELVGQWLAAGGDGWRDHVDVRAIADFPAWVSHAELWRDAGRPKIDKSRRGGGASGWAAPSDLSDLPDGMHDVTDKL